MINSIEILRDEFGILTTWKDNRPYFSGVGKHLIPTIEGGRPDERIRELMIDVETNWKKYIPEADERIIVKLPRQLLILYPREILKCVSGDEEIYEKALRRGKSERRYMAQERRY